MLGVSCRRARRVNLLTLVGYLPASGRRCALQWRRARTSSLSRVLQIGCGDRVTLRSPTGGRQLVRGGLHLALIAHHEQRRMLACR
jgi:hypothetical protein